ncbi:DNA-directed RNA polymerase I polypeptide [Xylona heveae TC161]|uniref:DNA-directed RNA polymerase subunit n=1 Tax=Xylona heveae (strain CBS 132557 / TC161) TaxID=1328760 RepID=A0A165HCA2_XYLHT|nr:DNA-directed RNA polymerase I polypeptide [Xylona heveae TC161]KZF23288.1 DNA-directed RNA polymerase I polypeptide [Xylona heveae TC161]
MSAIGTLVFCNDCGNLLDGSIGDPKSILTCDVCGAQCRDTSSNTVTTTSQPTDFPSALRSKRSAVQTVTAGDMKTEATIHETCPDCETTGQMRYYSVQLRSADEGSTNFFTCTHCGHKWNTNN